MHDTTVNEKIQTKEWENERLTDYRLLISHRPNFKRQATSSVLTLQTKSIKYAKFNLRFRSAEDVEFSYMIQFALLLKTWSKLRLKGQEKMH